MEKIPYRWSLLYALALVMPALYMVSQGCGAYYASHESCTQTPLVFIHYWIFLVLLGACVHGFFINRKRLGAVLVMFKKKGEK